MPHAHCHDAHGQRVLPEYYSDNYVNLAPGESREVAITGDTLDGAARVDLRGWNVRPQSVALDNQADPPARDAGD